MLALCIHAIYQPAIHARIPMYTAPHTILTGFPQTKPGISSKSAWCRSLPFFSRKDEAVTKAEHVKYLYAQNASRCVLGGGQHAFILLSSPRIDSCCFAHHDTIGTHIYFILFQRSGRRTADVFSVKIKMTVVASAPYVRQIGSVLDYASQVSADGSKGPEVSRCSPNQDSGLATEAKYLSRIRFYLFRLNRKSHHP